MKKITLLFLLLLQVLWVKGQSEELTIDEQAVYQAMVDSIESALTYQHGTIDLENGMATLHVPEGYKFLDAEQSEYVLTELWGNPPSPVLGMLFPEEVGPLSDSMAYAVEISYSEEGYIDDEDAQELDYDDLLEQMQEDTEEGNAARADAGYVPVHFLGWAAQPFYDAENKKLHWAKELQFEGETTNTLNYNIRVLGRRGYLNLNAIGTMEVLPQFQQDVDKVLASVSFNEGHRYSDFNPDIDRIAAYGIGGLIAGKLLTKVGFLAVLAKFWKVIALAVAGIFGGLRKKIFPSKNS